jgi:hypothetical protein
MTKGIHSRLDKETLIKLFFDYLHLTVLHYGLWFRETEHQLGLEKAMVAEAQAWEKILTVTIQRLAKQLDISLTDGVPQVLHDLDTKDLVNLLAEMSKNWVACDGVWFQTIENNYDTEMLITKRINDTNWVRFSPLEAKMIMRRFNLPENGGLPVLKEALQYRQYALINKYEMIDEGNKLIYRNVDCRVQSARKRRGLPDYPCRSSGVSEYRYFAEGIDPRIRVRCLGCPPGEHPPDWWCAWEFTMKE